MPDWKFPVSLPKMTTDKFKQAKAEYTAEHGYEVHFPRLSDIIHIKKAYEPTRKEFSDWKKGYREKLGYEKYYDIEKTVTDKRERYRRMLASPMPNWGYNVASVMTFFDDVNDTLGTIGVIARVAVRIFPKVLSKFFLGPIGWIFLAADLAGLVMSIMRLPFSCIANKRMFHSARDLNPFSRNARTARARKLRRIRPTKGELIEMAQTSDNVFGVGLCLGPIVGFAYDLVSGAYRTVKGEKVSWFSEPQEIPEHVLPCFRLLKSMPILAMNPDFMTGMDWLKFNLAFNGATQVLRAYINEENPLDHTEGMEFVETQAPKPIHETTKFVLEENGIFSGQRIGWPGLEVEYVDHGTLWDFYQGKAAETFKFWANKYRHDQVGAVACENGYEAGKNMQLLLEGEETVIEEMEPQWREWSNWFDSGCDFHECYSAYGARYTKFQRNFYHVGWHIVTVIGLSYKVKRWGDRFPDPVYVAPCGNCKIAFYPQHWLKGVYKDVIPGVLFEDALNYMPGINYLYTKDPEFVAGF